MTTRSRSRKQMASEPRSPQPGKTPTTPQPILPNIPFMDPNALQAQAQLLYQNPLFFNSALMANQVQAQMQASMLTPTPQPPQTMNPYLQPTPQPTGPVPQLTPLQIQQMQLSQLIVLQQMQLQALQQSTPPPQSPLSTNQIQLPQIQQIQQMMQQQKFPQTPTPMTPNPTINQFNNSFSFGLPTTPMPDPTPAPKPREVIEIDDFMKSTGPYDFTSQTEPKVEDTKNPKVGTKRRYRNTPPKHQHSLVDPERSRQAHARPRDQYGAFTKAPKTEVKDLQFKLNSSEYECNKLRQDLAGRNQEMAELKARLNEFERRDKHHQERLQYLELQQQSLSVEQLDYIRSMKARTQYLTQLQQRFAEKQLKEMSSPDPMQTQTINSPLPPIEPIVGGSPVSIVQSPGLEPTLVVSPSVHQQMAQETNTIPIISPFQPIASESNFHQPQPHDHHPSHPQSVPATWFNYNSLWNETIRPAFQEKIDFSTIQLRPHGQPPNLVEQARMEYLEAQQRWKDQQEQLQRARMMGLPPPVEPPRMQTLVYPTMPDHGPLQGTPAFAAKINFEDEKSRLKKINSVAKLDHPFPQSPSIPMDLPTSPSIHMTDININGLHNMNEMMGRPMGRSPNPTPPPLSPNPPHITTQTQQTQLPPQTPLQSLFNNNPMTPSSPKDQVMFEDCLDYSPSGISDDLGIDNDIGISSDIQESLGWNFGNSMFQDNEYYHRIPTPTALIWRAELERKAQGEK